MPVVVGVDGGGTHTEIIAIPLDVLRQGREIAPAERSTVTVGASNFFNLGGAQFEQTLRDGIERLGVDLTEAFFVGGISGLETESLVNAARQRIAQLGFSDSKITVMCDSDLALRALNDNGVIAILGSGSTFVGKRGGMRVQVGGLGPEYREPGSGYELGHDVFNRAVTFSEGALWEGGNPVRETLIASLVLEQLGWTDFSKDRVLEFLYQGDASERRARFSNLAPILLAAAELNDRIALSIVDHHAERITASLSAVCERLGFDDIALGLVGGVALNKLGEAYLLPRVLKQAVFASRSVILHRFGLGSGQKDLLVEAMRASVGRDD